MKDSIEKLEDFQLTIQPDSRVPIRWQPVPKTNPDVAEVGGFLVFRPESRMYERNYVIEHKGDERPVPTTYLSDFISPVISQDCPSSNLRDAPKAASQTENGDVTKSRLMDPLSNSGLIVTSRILRLKQTPETEANGKKLRERESQALSILPQIFMDPAAKRHVADYLRKLPQDQREQTVNTLTDSTPILSFTTNKDLSVINKTTCFLNASPDSQCLDVIAYDNLRFMRDGEDVIEDRDAEDDTTQPGRNQLDVLFGLEGYPIIFEFLQAKEIGGKTLRFRTGIAVQDIDFGTINFQLKRMMRRDQIPTDRISQFVKMYLYIDFDEKKQTNQDNNTARV